MKNKFLSLNSILVILVLFIVNNYLFSQTKFTEQKAGNVIYMAVPNYLVKTKDLNDSAILQYMNSTKEAYLVVLDDSKEELEVLGKKFETVSEFQTSIAKPLVEGLKNSKETPKKIFEIDNKKYCQTTLSGTFTSSSGTEFEITYLITCVETPENFYQILCWSTNEFYAGLIADFEQISKSLKEGACK
jgi:hypothetical protein